MKREVDTAAIRKYERSIRGVPVNAESEVRWLVVNNSGSAIFESHDSNQAEGVRLKTVGSRLVKYDPKDVVSTCQEAMNKIQEGAGAETLTEDVEDSDALTCPVCESESGDDEICTEGGSDMDAEEEEDEEDVDEDDEEDEEEEGEDPLASCPQCEAEFELDLEDVTEEDLEGELIVECPECGYEGVVERASFKNLSHSDPLTHGRKAVGALIRGGKNLKKGARAARRGIIGRQGLTPQDPLHHARKLVGKALQGKSPIGTRKQGKRLARRVFLK
jgi:DNA-directed RNA polymerase subunit RPC12/RpoP